MRRALVIATLWLVACGGAGDEPVAIISADVYQGLRPTTVSFDGSASLSVGELPLRYEWDFGDGDGSTEAAPQHIYTRAGVFTVSLTVWASQPHTSRWGVAGTPVTRELGSSHTSSTVIAVSSWEREVLLLTNEERRSNGVHNPLAPNDLLAIAAERHNLDMIENNFFDHTGSDGSSPFERMRDAGYSYTTAGENIAAGQRSPRAVVTAWMNSPGHRANILNAGFWELGVAHTTATGARYDHYWTQKFGTSGDYRPVVINAGALSTSDPRVQVYTYGAAWASEMAITATPEPSEADFMPFETESYHELTGDVGRHWVYVTLRAGTVTSQSSAAIVLVSR